MASVVLGIGSYLPKKCLSNDDLSEFLDTSDSWIVQRAGIRRRYIAADNEHTSDLATHAARAAIENSGVSPQSIDLIVLATATPDNTFPSTAVSVQAHLGITGGAAFDIQAVCSGFIFALATADSFLRAGMARRALVIGAETFSRILDWTDRSTCVLFGDGAGAVVLEYQQEDRQSEQQGEKKNARQEEQKARGILSCHLRSDGRHKSLLYVDGGPSTTGKSGYVRMNGREIFKFAVGKISGVVDDAFSANNIGPNDLDWFVPHQANRRIITASAKKLAIPLEKTIITVDAHANTSAASIPLALDVGVQDGRIQPGHLILLEALGGGLTWGSALLRW